LHWFRERFNLKNIKIIGEAALADEAAAATFPAELKGLSRRKNYDPRQVFICVETCIVFKP
jgi:hypothetical protein